MGDKPDGLVMTTMSEDDKEGLLTKDEFLRLVEDETLIDYDGFGYLATAEQESGIPINPSDVPDFEWPEWATHVNWYNR